MAVQKRSHRQYRRQERAVAMLVQLYTTGMYHEQDFVDPGRGTVTKILVRHVAMLVLCLLYNIQSMNVKMWTPWILCQYRIHEKLQALCRRCEHPGTYVNIHFTKFTNIVHVMWTPWNRCAL